MNQLPYKTGIDGLVALALHDKQIREEKLKIEAEEKMRLRSQRIISLENILKDICETLEEPIDKVSSHDRHANYVRCRHLYYYVSDLKTGYTNKQIGALIHGADHTTVIHGKRKVSDQLEVGEESLITYWRYYIHNSKLFIPEDFE